MIVRHSFADMRNRYQSGENKLKFIVMHHINNKFLCRYTELPSGVQSIGPLMVHFKLIHEEEGKRHS